MEYTEGEWNVNDVGFERYSKYRKTVTGGKSFVVNTSLGMIASCEGDSQEESEANAHLIAAAPDMYEALKYFYTHFLTFIEDVKPGTWIYLDDYFSPQDRGKLEDVKQALSKAKPNVEW